jgi:hypothetical protein
VAFVNAEGPVHAYVAPVTAGVVNRILEPKQTGELLLGVGVAGIGFTTTVAVPGADVQPPEVTVTL